MPRKETIKPQKRRDMSGASRKLGGGSSAGCGGMPDQSVAAHRHASTRQHPSKGKKH